MQKTTQRIEYIDAMRGFTMILVVLHHVSLMAFGRNSVTDEWLVEFRMPLFFFVSGFVLYKSARQWNMKEYFTFLRRKLDVQILSPIIFFCIYVYIYNRGLLGSLIDPNKSGYWFTFMLFAYYVMYIAIQMLLDKLLQNEAKKDGLLILTGCSVFIGAYGLQYLYLEKDMVIMGFIGGAHYKYFLFFIGGVLVRKYFCSFEKVLDSSYFLPFCISLYFLLNIFSVPINIGGGFYRIFFILSTAITGIVVVFSFFRRYQGQFSKDKLLGKTLQKIGRRTLDIYLLHYFFIPYQLSDVFPLYLKYNLPVVELACSLVVTSLVIACCLLISATLRISPELASFLFGAKKDKRCE